MDIQKINLTFPFDFLERLLQCEKEPAVRCFRAEIQSKGEISNLDSNPPECSITYTPKAGCANLILNAHRFPSENGFLFCHLTEWNETESKSKDSDNNSKLNRPVGLRKCSKSKERLGRKRNAINEDASSKITIQSPKRRKTNSITSNITEVKSSSPTKPAKSKRPSQKELEINEKNQKEDKSKGRNLRPRISKVDWSQINQDSEEESEDAFIPDGDAGESEDEMTLESSNPVQDVEDKTVITSTKTKCSEIQHRPLVLIPRLQLPISPVLASKALRPTGRSKGSKALRTTGQSKGSTMRKSNPKRKLLSKPSSKPQDCQSKDKVGKMGKGNRKVGSVLNIATSFPLDECGTVFRVVESKGHTDGILAPLALVASSETESNVPVEVCKVSFYSNISKGVESHPKNYPRELHKVSVAEEASIPIFINVKRKPQPSVVFVPERKTSTLTTKLYALKKKLTQNASDINTSIETESSSSQSAFTGSYSLQHKLEEIKKKPGAVSGPEVLAVDSTEQLMKKSGIEASDKHDIPQEDSEDRKKMCSFVDTSSSDSEQDYLDEMDLKIPYLSVTYPKSMNVKYFFRSSVTLKVGNKIPILNFVVCSTKLLKAVRERYYIQGQMRGVEGRVLLGPFTMEYDPQPYLSFMRVTEQTARIPKHIYDRRRQRWLRKHEKKRFPRPKGGTPAIKKLVFVDHDYFNNSYKDIQTNSSQVPHASVWIQDSVNHPILKRTTTANQQAQDLILVSTKGLDDDTLQEDDENSTYNLESENKIPVIESLEDAMTVKKTFRQKAPPNTQGSIHEPVCFKDLPSVGMEATVNSSGRQLNLRILRRQKQSEEPTQAIENDDSSHIPLKYTCQYCLKLYVDNFRLSDHIKSDHQNHPGFVDYARQVRTSEGEKCKFCVKETIFHSRDGLRVHMNVKHPDKVAVKPHSIMKRTCPTCKQVFSQRGSLQRHIERIHVGATFLCDRCPGIFKSEKALNAHIMGKHDNVRNCVCHICGASYVTDSYLRRHIKAVHGKQKESAENSPSEKVTAKMSGKGAPGKSRFGEVKKCFLCEYTFDSVNLKKHLKQIHGVEANDTKKCAECPLVFNNRPELEYHRYSAHDFEYEYNCPYCGACYMKRHTMQEHILTFHYSIDLHHCYVCDKNFSRTRHLADHINEEHNQMHGQDMKLKCHHCSGIFSSHHDLTYHLLSPAHHEVFKHNCLTCPQRFMHEADLEHHIKIVHSRDGSIDFEIRCHSKTDKIVQMIVSKDINEISDLPPKAQLALKRLHNQGKQVMIVSRLKTQETTPMEKPANPTSKSSKKKPNSNKGSKRATKSSAIVNSETSASVSRTGTASSEASNVTHPGPQKEAEICVVTSGPEAEVLKVYRMAVQSEELAKAVGNVSQHQELEQDQLMTVDEECVEAEQIGRLDESGNVLMERVVYVEEAGMAEDLLFMLQSQSFIQ